MAMVSDTGWLAKQLGRCIYEATRTVVFSDPKEAVAFAASEAEQKDKWGQMATVNVLGCEVRCWYHCDSSD